MLVFSVLKMVVAISAIYMLYHHNTKGEINN